MAPIERQKLERYLQSVGKSVFVEIMYPELRKNMDIDYEYIAQKYKQYSNILTMRKEAGCQPPKQFLGMVGNMMHWKLLEVAAM